jgi:hypothetical protein
MRKSVCAAAVVGLSLWLCPARAEEDPARAVLDRAVKALGGADKLGQLQGVSFRSQGIFQAGDQKVEMSGDVNAQALHRFRWQISVTFMGRTESGVLVLDGDKGWIQGGGQQARDLPPEALALLQTDLRVVRLAQRLVPLSEKGFSLAPLGELKIEQRDAVGIKVTHAGQPDLDLFFDKESGLPLRAEVRVKEDKDGQEVLHAFTFGDYKEVNGVKQFTRLSLQRDGKPAMELELSNFDLRDRLDDALFAKP